MVVPKGLVVHLHESTGGEGFERPLSPAEQRIATYCEHYPEQTCDACGRVQVNAEYWVPLIPSRPHVAGRLGDICRTCRNSKAGWNNALALEGLSTVKAKQRFRGRPKT